MTDRLSHALNLLLLAATELDAHGVRYGMPVPGELYETMTLHPSAEEFRTPGGTVVEIRVGRVGLSAVRVVGGGNVKVGGSE